MTTAKELTDQISKAMEWQPIEVASEGQQLIVWEPDYGWLICCLDDGKWMLKSSGNYWSPLPLEVKPECWHALPSAPGKSDAFANMRVILSSLADAERERDELRKDFGTLCKAIVGETGLSAIEEAGKLRARAQAAEAKLAEALALVPGEPVATWKSFKNGNNYLDVHDRDLFSRSREIELYTSPAPHPSADRDALLEEARRVIEPFAKAASLADERNSHGGSQFSFPEATIEEFRAAHSFLSKLEVKS